jgi:NAD(P)-dependent dehydrogenase (short-subunit alcohol dehydrogenase family)
MRSPPLVDPTTGSGRTADLLAGAPRAPSVTPNTTKAMSNSLVQLKGYFEPSYTLGHGVLRPVRPDLEAGTDLADRRVTMVPMHKLRRTWRTCGDDPRGADIMPGVLIVGTGPGIATSVASRFGVSGMPVGLVARSQESIDRACASLAQMGVDAIGTTADAAQEAQLKTALDILVGTLGVPDVLVYNAGLIQYDRPGELGHERHLAAYATNVLGALTAVSHLAPAMAEAGGGTVVITGGKPEPEPDAVSLSLGKAGVRALTTLLAKEYGPTGVHIATVCVCGAVAPGTEFDPDRIATHYWRLHKQQPDDWEHQVIFAGEPK